MSEALIRSSLVAAAQEGETAGETGEGFGIGAFVLILVIVALLLWLGYLFVNSRRSRAAIAESSPLNQTPYMSDDELENVRTTRVLRAAVVAAIALAIILPWYAFNESDRTAEATEEFAQLDIEEGLKWYVQFECVACHGQDLGGGTAEFIEPRSGVITSWLVPSLNDVLYRYDESEVRFIIEYGRQGTPMPAAGLEGGGSMTLHEVDQLIAYIRSEQIPQADVVAKADRNVDLALLRIDNGEAATQIRINQQRARIDNVEDAAQKDGLYGGLADETADLLGGAGTCTAKSAEMVTATCNSPGLDTDRDGLADAAEVRLSEIAALAHENLTELGFNSDGTANPVLKPIYDVGFDPANAFTNSDDAGQPVADLEAADLMLEALESDLLLVGITAEREDEFLTPLREGLAFLEEAAALRLWEVDFGEVSAAMGVPLEDAQRAVGLFNAYCGRCHSGGYSAGVTFETGPGTGAWGPAINHGRTPVQFPATDSAIPIEDHIEFVIQGSTNAMHYGVNGIGTGRMPGFGTSLTAEDITLIVEYERTL